jgi:uncharacterized protein YbaR (Trm112 family)
MKHRLLNILACPIDKHYPLDLKEFETDEEEIMAGILLCSECGRFYPIMEGIPSMLPDDLRTEKRELEFLTLWKDKLPSEVITRGRPFKLKATE